MMVFFYSCALSLYLLFLRTLLPVPHGRVRSALLCFSSLYRIIRSAWFWFLSALYGVSTLPHEKTVRAYCTATLLKVTACSVSKKHFFHSCLFCFSSVPFPLSCLFFSIFPVFVPHGFTGSAGGCLFLRMSSEHLFHVSRNSSALLFPFRTVCVLCCRLFYRARNHFRVEKEYGHTVQPRPPRGRTAPFLCRLSFISSSCFFPYILSVPHGRGHSAWFILRILRLTIVQHGLASVGSVRYENSSVQ